MNYTIHPGVDLGQNVTIGLYCIIGVPFGDAGSVDETRIGDNSVVRSHTIIYAGNHIGCSFQSGHGAFIRECNSIGDDVSIGTKAVVEHHVTIEDGVRIHSQAFVPEFCVLKRGSWIGPNVVLTNAKYPRSPSAKSELVGPTIEEYAKIGANATILPGITVGAHALVGAGSVVVRDVPPRAVVAGNPARILKPLDELPYGSSQ